MQQEFQRSDQKATASKVGFVAMMLPIEDRAWMLHEFHGVCLTCRPRDARNYVLTLRSENALGEHRTEDLYQTRLQPFVAHAKPALAGDDAELGIGNPPPARPWADGGRGIGEWEGGGVGCGCGVAPPCSDAPDAECALRMADVAAADASPHDHRPLSAEGMGGVAWRAG